MVRHCTFRLKTGQSISPLFSAPWRANDAISKADLPPILEHLGGEWPCVPFGGPGCRNDLPEGWNAANTEDWDGFAHGFGSNHDWKLSKPDRHAIRAEIPYPAKAPISRLIRHIRLNPDRPVIDFALSVHVRRKTRVPIGLHPVLDLAGFAPESCRLETGSDAKAWSFPVDVEAGRTAFAPNQQDVPFCNLRAPDGTPANTTMLPRVSETEDLLLLTNTGGAVTLIYPQDQYRIRLSWEQEKLPSCVLWYSNGGRLGHPWLGKVRAIGIEPVAAAFDLGIGHSLSRDTPLSRAEVDTAVLIHPDQPFNIRYSLELLSAP